jgi:aspartyl-tRNA(Asn)/glutamyl-tRNA(Gln) amidotransferase subunit C
MITKGDIEKLAVLSRISLGEEEKESLARDIEGILSYVKEISSIRVDKIYPWEPNRRNVFREDRVENKSGQYTADLLRSAPEREKNYFKVKKIL